MKLSVRREGKEREREIEIESLAESEKECRKCKKDILLIAASSSQSYS